MKKESIFDNKTFLVVLSVVMAFLAWIFVSLNSNDTKGKTISGIAIDMQQVDESILGRAAEGDRSGGGCNL